MFERGIEANLEKITAISNMGPICNVNSVQRLTGCLAALSRFISRLGERGMPLYKLLKKTDMFTWTEEAQQALESLKASLTSAPILIAPKRGEPLLLYVVASNHVVSAALVVEREEPGHHLKVQWPIYFVGGTHQPHGPVPLGAETLIHRADGNLEAPALLHRP